MLFPLALWVTGPPLRRRVAAPSRRRSSEPRGPPTTAFTASHVPPRSWPPAWRSRDAAVVSGGSYRQSTERPHRGWALAAPTDSPALLLLRAGIVRGPLTPLAHARPPCFHNIGEQGPASSKPSTRRAFGPSGIGFSLTRARINPAVAPLFGSPVVPVGRSARSGAAHKPRFGPEHWSRGRPRARSGLRMFVVVRRGAMCCCVHRATVVSPAARRRS